MLKRLFSLVLVCVGMSLAQESLVGNWEGVIGPDSLNLGILVRFDETDGALAGTIDIPLQQARGLPLRVAVTADSVTFVIEGVPGEATFTGRLSGDEIAGDFEQGGQEFSFFLERTDAPLSLNRPQTPERPFPYLEEDITIQSGEVTLAGTLTLPEGEGPFAAVLFISGSGAQDRDEALFGHRPFLLLSDAITRAGLATLRFDDRGVGGSTGDLSQASYDDLVADILAGVDVLKSRPEIDAGRIGLFGHSEGGYLAPLAASRSEDIDFVVMMAAPAVSGLRVLELQNQLVFRLAGASEADIAAQLDFLRTSVELLEREAYDALEVLVSERIRSQFAALPAGDRPSDAEQQMIIDMQVASVVSPYFRSFMLYDPTPALRQLDVPVLAFYGNLDIQVPPVQSVGPLRAALRLAGNVDVTIEVFDGLNHLLQPAMTGALEEYAQIETTIAPEVLELVTNWLTERFVD